MTAAEGLAETTGVVAACTALAVARATYYRRRRAQLQEYQKGDKQTDQ